MKTKILAALALVTFSAGQAAVLEHVFTLTTAPDGQRFAVPQFNPSSGTLTSVKFSITTGTILLGIENSSAAADTVGFEVSNQQAQTDVTLASNASTHLVTSALSAAVDFAYEERAVAAFDGTLNYGGASGWTSATPISTPTATTTYLGTSGVGTIFKGTGNVQVDVKPLIEFDLSLNPVGANPTMGSVLTTQLTVTYDFVAVPEPQWGMFVVGLAIGTFALVRCQGRLSSRQ